MVPPTHREAGCLQYDLHESREIPDVRQLSRQGKISFVFIERWRSEDDLKQHVAMPYHDDFLAILEETGEYSGTATDVVIDKSKRKEEKCAPNQ